MSVRLFSFLIIGCLLGACESPRQAIAIPFSAQFEGAAIGCEPTDKAFRLSDLRFYVHDLQLLTAEGQPVAVILDEDGMWQGSGIALLDLENNRGDCVNGTDETNASVRGSVPPGSYTGLRFVVGVPFEQNHGDPLLAKPPLGDPAMHWHWRSGYKFLRAGVRSADDGYWLHLGSTGCRGTTGNISECTSANRVPVEISDFAIGSDSVVVNLTELLREIDLGDGAPTDCSSGPAETACVAAFAALGIDFPQGTRAGVQRVFRKRVHD